jgi:hypothetical protein
MAEAGEVRNPVAALKLSSPHEGGWRSKLRQPEVLAAAVLTVVAIGLHIIFLFHPGGLWRDEVNTVNLAGRGSLAEMARDSFPVLMPLIVHGWRAIGLASSDITVRVLGMLIGVGLLGALWVSAWQTSGLAPRLGLALFAVNGTMIIYGDSLRAYGLGALLIVLAFSAVWSLLQKPTAGRVLWAAAMAVLSVQGLYQNAVLVAAICFGAWAVAGRRRCWRLAAPVAIVAVVSAASLVPYLGVLRGSQEGAAVLRGGFQWPRAWGTIHYVAAFPLEIYSYAWVAAVLAVLVGGWLALTSKGLGSATPAGPASAADLRLFAAVTLLTGFLGFWAFHWYVAMPLKPWYLLPFLAVGVACFDAGLPILPRLLRTVLLGGMLATAFIMGTCGFRVLSIRLTNVDLLARRLAAEAVPGDYILVAPWYCGMTFERYYHGSAPWNTLPPLKDHSQHRYDLLREQLQSPNAIQPVMRQMEETLRAGHKVWVMGHMIIFRKGTPPPASLPPAPLPESGWSDAPYQRIWLAQVACFLGEHSRHLERVQTSPAGEVNPNEDLELVQAVGWQASFAAR